MFLVSFLFVLRMNQFAPRFVDSALSKLSSNMYFCPLDGSQWKVIKYLMLPNLYCQVHRCVYLERPCPFWAHLHL